MKVHIKEIQTNMEAFDVYSLFKDTIDIIYLDSSKNLKQLGNHSFIGINPFKKIVYSHGQLKEDGNIISGSPFTALNKLLKKYSIENETDLPFVGGCMGYFAYDLVKDIEGQLIDSDIPTAYFVFYNNIIIYDHQNNKTYITELVKENTGSRSIDLIEAIIKKGKKVTYGKLIEEDRVNTCTSPFSKQEYIKAVEAMRNYIEEGDIYIANMTNTYTATTKRSGYDIYKTLRQVNQAPFSAYLPLDGFEVLCSSPERFIQIKKGLVETRPIKGTRPRGNTAKEDEALALELKNSEKDRSELLMVVDLERNDLSKVCKPHTVKVTELFNIESYATVHHLVSTVVGELEDDKTSVDCIEACFPGGSITGTPKIRAMEIIEEIEIGNRQLYTGCIGYFGFDGGSDFNIIIRTILKKGNNLSIGVGGGITWESDALDEYEETLDKAKALFKAIKMKEYQDECID